MSSLLRRTHWGLEYSIHDCPARFARELKTVFPKADPSDTRIVPTCQKAVLDLTNWGNDVEQEKDALLEKFSEWAELLCQKLIAAGYWADYIDPCSGLPMINKNAAQPYNEVDGFSVLLGYKLFNAGFCKVLMHPEWGTNVYPATLFTDAPQQLIASTIAAMESETAESDSQ